MSSCLPSKLSTWHKEMSIAWKLLLRKQLLARVGFISYHFIYGSNKTKGHSVVTFTCTLVSGKRYSFIYYAWSSHFSIVYAQAVLHIMHC
jgi:hypothetical protein